MRRTPTPSFPSSGPRGAPRPARVKMAESAASAAAIFRRVASRPLPRPYRPTIGLGTAKRNSLRVVLAGARKPCARRAAIA